MMAAMGVDDGIDLPAYYDGIGLDVPKVVPPPERQIG